MNSLVGIGVYDVSEASRLTGIATSKIRRWLFGYATKQSEAEVSKYAALWTPEPSLDDLDQTLSFHDLLEIRFVDAFRKHGVSLQAIRVASEHAKDWFDSPYPFTCRRFQTDGQSIFATTLEKTGDEHLIDLVKKQYVFKQVIKPSLYAGIDYGDHNQALRWYPISRSKKVVLDPARSFGKPILADSGITTETIFTSWQAEDQNSSYVASLYGLTKDEVELAVRFELRMASGEISN